MADDHFDDADFSGARFRNVDFSRVKMVDALLVDADLSGMIDGLRINGVEVAPLIEEELKRLYPERAKLFVNDPDGLVQSWSTIESLWDTTVQRARTLPDAKLREQVDEEWSFIETLRHLVFATDAWIGRVALGRTDAFHPWGRPPTFLKDAGTYGIDDTADPSLDEVLAVRRERMAMVRDVLQGLTADGLERQCSAPDSPGYPAAASVRLRDCVFTILEEEWWHNRFANRDLDTLESPPT